MKFNFRHSPEPDETFDEKIETSPTENWMSSKKAYSMYLRSQSACDSQMRKPKIRVNKEPPNLVMDLSQGQNMTQNRRRASSYIEYQRVLDNPSKAGKKG